MMDSDRKLGKGKQRSRINLNATKKRILEEVKNINGFAWVTEGREVENYIHPKILSKISGRANVKTDKYDKIIDKPFLASYKKDKLKIAHDVPALLERKHLNYLDLEVRLNELADQIRRWNDLL